MYCWLPPPPPPPPPLAGVTVTFCCLVVCSLLFACALLRRRWIASITSACCASTASPSFWVQSSLSLIVLSTSGVAARLFTLSSQPCLSTSVLSASPLRFLFWSTQRAACTTSSG